VQELEISSIEGAQETRVLKAVNTILLRLFAFNHHKLLAKEEHLLVLIWCAQLSYQRLIGMLQSTLVIVLLSKYLA